MFKQTDHSIYMERAYQLAKLASKDVKTNPKVGAVLVYNDRIIGEGYHMKYGSHHAEVNAISSVKVENQYLIEKASIYITLEPCCYHGKTPACTDLIIKHKIKKVYISCLDPNPKVSGKGISILKNHGVKVNIGLCSEMASIIEPFKSNQDSLPFVTLKWAMSNDNYMGLVNHNIHISNHYSQVFTHDLRSKVDAILIGSNTLKTDNPKLNTRVVEGDDPIRLVLGRRTSNIFSLEKPTDIYIGDLPQIDERNLKEVLSYLFTININSILVEGGKQVLESFIKEDLWNKAYIIQSSRNIQSVEGVKPIRAPNLSGQLIETYNLSGDKIFEIENYS